MNYRKRIKQVSDAQRAKLKIRNEVKDAVRKRDNETCTCPYHAQSVVTNSFFASILTVAHIIGLGRGGPDTEENMTCLCQACHMWLDQSTGLYLRGTAPDNLEWSKRHFNLVDAEIAADNWRKF